MNALDRPCAYQVAVADARRLTLIWELKMMNDKCDRLWRLRRVQTEHREFRSAMLEDENSCQAKALGNAMPPERTGRLKADRELFALLHACVNPLSCQANTRFVARVRLLTPPPFDQASKACAYA